MFFDYYLMKLLMYLVIKEFMCGIFYKWYFVKYNIEIVKKIWILKYLVLRIFDIN